MKRRILGWVAILCWLPHAVGRASHGPAGADPFELLGPAFLAEDGTFGHGSPDIALAAGTTHLVLARNNSVTLFSRAAGAQNPQKVAEMDSRAFLQPAAQGDDRISDPYVLWDVDGGRFYVAMAAFGKTGCDPALTCTNSILLAVSKSASPATLTSVDWYFYRIDRMLHRVGGVTTVVQDEGDYDKLAVVGDTLLISWQMVKHGIGNIGQVVRLLDRRLLMRGEAPSDWVDFELPPPPAGSERLRVATQFDRRDARADRVFFDVRAGCANDWKIAALVDLRGTPRLETRTIAAPIACPSYPVTSAQPGTAARIYIQHLASQPAYRDGKLWVFEPVGRSAADSTAEIVWAELDVRAWPSVTVLQSGRISGGASHAFGAAAAIDSVGNVGILYTQAGASEFPSVYFTGRLVTDPPGTLRPARLVRSGVRAVPGPNATPNPTDADNTDPTAAAFIDYQTVTVDPNDGSLWLAGLVPGPLTGRRAPDPASLSDVWMARVRPIAESQPGVPAMALSTSTMTFAAVGSGTGFTAQTGSQIVRLMQSGAGPVEWTATPNRPWLKVSPASGSGPATLTVSVHGAASTDTGQIEFAVTGATGIVGPLVTTLTVMPTGTSRPPVGVLDTPLENAAGLSGSVALTGWALDDLGVTRVELWRDLQSGETTVPFSSAGDPRSGKVFIANATFVDDARPDIEALYPKTPMNYRAGWGYLLLTWGLWNQGNGTYNLHAFAFDREGSIAAIGSRTMVVDNNAATKPFGSIDTPAIGGDPGSIPNFGWALTPRTGGVARCRIPHTGVQVSIDSGPLQPVVYGDVRDDIAAAFPGFSNAGAAGGHYAFDWSTLQPGPHTIGWLVTDDCNRTDGVGSRLFSVTTGAAVTATPAEFARKGDTRPSAEFHLKPGATSLDRMVAAFTDVVASAFQRNEESGPVLVSRGYGELPVIVPVDRTGSRTVEITQGQRIELRLPRGFVSASQIGPAGTQRPLPAGSTWDAAAGTFYWQPAPGFLGRYEIVFANGRERISVRLVVAASP